MFEGIFDPRGLILNRPEAVQRGRFSHFAIRHQVRAVQRLWTALQQFDNGDAAPY
jgi:hypothetical protein